MGRKKIVSKKLCPSCGSNRTVKDGLNGGKEYRRCNQCGRKFLDKYIDTKAKRLVFLSDIHCGHVNGLLSRSFMDKANDFQREMRVWFENTLELIKPVHIVACVGDLIDGRQEKNGGAELCLNSRILQTSCASEIIEEFNALKVYMVKGTPYHTGKQEDWEEIIASNVEAEVIANSLNIDVNGCVINMKHKVGRSSVPYAKATPLAKELMWEKLMREQGDKDYNIVVRGHVHYHVFTGFSNNHVAMTLPALQGASDYGEKECTGNVDLGLVVVDIEPSGIFTWRFMKFKSIQMNQKVHEVTFDK